MINLKHRLACGVAALCLCAGLALHPAQAQRRDGPAGPIPVRVGTVIRADIPVLLRNIGTVQANQSVLVRARVDGTLEQEFFHEGQEVTKGQLLAQIDPRPYQAVLAQAQAKQAADAAQLANAQRDLHRYAALLHSNVSSRQQVDTQAALVAQDQATLAGDRATVQAAQLNLDFTRITAPIAGRVGLRLVDAGNLIHATDTTGIVNIAQIHPIAVLFALPQDTLERVRTAMGQAKLDVVATDAAGKVLDRGQLRTIDNSIDPTSGTYKLKALFANKAERLWPGQSVNVALRVATLKNVPTLPAAAIQRGPEGEFVYLVGPRDIVAVRNVTLAQNNGEVAVIAKGLAPGAKVVVAGQSRLRQGSRIIALTTPEKG